MLGVLLCLPNLFPAPAAWLPWRTVHLGLDLRGGSYLLMEVDMGAVIKERLDSLADGVRAGAAARPRSATRPWTPQPAQNRVLLRLRDPAQHDAALAALQPLISRPVRPARPDLDDRLSTPTARSR